MLAPRVVASGLRHDVAANLGGLTVGDADNGSESLWLLVGLEDSAAPRREVIVNPLPFRIGRRKESALCLPAASVSKDHCELRGEEGVLAAVDLGSTNGTYVNGHRVRQPTALDEGDVLQVGECGFQLTTREIEPDFETGIRDDKGEQSALEFSFIRDVMGGHGLSPFFQPIVRLNDSQAMVGVEALARSGCTGLQSAGDLFRVARRLDLETTLSERCRSLAGEMSRELPGELVVFLNTFPREVGSTKLFSNLNEIRRRQPSLRLALEIHEEAIPEISVIRDLREELKRLDILLAYDDFGAGSARIHELTEAPPDILKFDQRLIRGLPTCPKARRTMIEALVAMVRGLGVTALAEGIETPEEAQICRDLGFELAQGYYFGRPMPIDHVQREIRSLNETPNS